MVQDKALHLLYVASDVNLTCPVQKMLQQLGYVVDVVNGDNKSAVILEPQVYDAVLADCHTSLGNDQLSAMRDLVNLKSSPPLIVVIEPGCEQVALDVMNIGAYDYVVKDSSGRYLELLPAVIEQALQRRQLVVEKEKALADLEQRNRDLTLLTRVGQELTATLDFQQVIGRLLQGVTETIGVEGSSVWLWEGVQRGALVCQAASHRGFRRKLVDLSVSPGQGLVGWVAQNKRSAVVPSVEDDGRFSPDIDAQIEFKTTDLLAVPLLVRDEVIGVLEVVNKLEGAFDDHDRILIETLAASSAIAIENARLIEALRQKTRQLEQRNIDLDAFAHTVAHNLKNPLSLIAGTAQVLETDCEDLPEETLRHHLGVMARNSRKASSLIEELLLLSELNHAEIYVEPLSMHSILNEVQRRLASMVRSYQAKIILPASWPRAVGYAPWIEEVWVNYLSNALKYGGRPPRIELGATPEAEGMIRFWVQDNGVGLTAEEKLQLFRPFTRFNRVQTTGYGLGLSIVRRILEKLGGHVGVESNGIPGEGSTFSFTLPDISET